MLLFTGSRRSVLDGNARLRYALQGVRNVDDRSPDTGADVESARVQPLNRRKRSRGGGKSGRGDISDVHVVPCLLSVAEDRESPAVENPAAEDRHHTGLTVRVLTRTVHVAVAQRHRVEAMYTAVVGEIQLHAQLRDRVRRLRILRKGLAVGRLDEVAVQHSTRR